MKKLLSLLLLTLTVSCFNVSAKTDKLYATFGDRGGNATFDSETNTLSWSQSNSNYMNIFTGLKTKISKYKKLHIEVKECTSNYRVMILCDNNESTVSFNQTYTTSTEIDLDTLTLITSGHTKANINKIRISGSGNNSTGSVKLGEIYLETYEYESLTVTTTMDNTTTLTSPFQWFTSNDGTSCTEVTSGSFFKKQFSNGSAEGVHVKEIISKAGSNLGWGNGFFDLTDYNKVCVNVNNFSNEYDNQIRLLETKSANTTNNVYVSLSGNKNEADINVKWCSGIYSSSTNSQDIKSVDFIKEFLPEQSSTWSFAHNVQKSTVEYDRTFTTGRKCTICLPFALSASEVSEAGTFYELNGFENGQLSFTAVTETEAYVPYVFEPASTQPFANLTNKTIVASANNDVTEGEVTFKGSLSHISDLAATETGNNVYGYSASNGTFVKVGTGVSIDAFRAYLVIPSSSGMNSVRASFDEPIQTGIESIEKTQISSNAYNLNGQMVSRNAKGMVICNGKIVINK